METADNHTLLENYSRGMHSFVKLEELSLSLCKEFIHDLVQNKQGNRTSPFFLVKFIS